MAKSPELSAQAYNTDTGERGRAGLMKFIQNIQHSLGYQVSSTEVNLSSKLKHKKKRRKRTGFWVQL